MTNEFPIMAYLGVHNNPNLDLNFQDFKDCGFNISMWRYSDYQNENHTGFREACSIANKYGIDIIACSDYMYEKPAEAAKKMKKIPNLYGYYMVDEPNMSQIKEFKQRCVDPIRSIDIEHPIYANLLPHYDDGILEYLGVKTYREYLDASLDLLCDHISFDFYPVTKDGLRRDAWYNNLQEIADFAKDNNKDFWAFILSVPHIVYPLPEMSHLRIQAYTNLAYGAQGLEYFTYQTPVNDPLYDFHNGPIDVDYKTKTNTWDLVKNMNIELKLLLPIFHNATGFKVVRTHHILWWNQICCKDLPEGFSSIKTRGSDGAIVSTFTNNNKQYVMIVNSSYTDDVQLTVNAKGYLYVGKDLEVDDMNKKYILHAGDCEIFVKI